MTRLHSSAAPAKISCLFKLSTYNRTACYVLVSVCQTGPRAVWSQICRASWKRAGKMDFERVLCFAESRVPCHQRRRRRARGKVMLCWRRWRATTRLPSARWPREARKAPTPWTLWVTIRSLIHKTVYMWKVSSDGIEPRVWVIFNLMIRFFVCVRSVLLQKRRSGRQVKRRKYNEDLDFKVVDDDGETIAVLGAGRIPALSSTLAWQAEVTVATSAIMAALHLRGDNTHIYTHTEMTPICSFPGAPWRWSQHHWKDTCSTNG